QRRGPRFAPETDRRQEAFVEERGWRRRSPTQAENTPMTILVEHLNAIGARWALWMFSGMVDAAALLALVGLLWLALRGRVAPPVGYCRFLLVPLKLPLPVSVTAPASITRWTPSEIVLDWQRPSIAPQTEQPAPGEMPPAATTDFPLALRPAVEPSS